MLFNITILSSFGGHCCNSYHCCNTIISFRTISFTVNRVISPLAMLFSLLYTCKRFCLALNLLKQCCINRDNLRQKSCPVLNFLTDNEGERDKNKTRVSYFPVYSICFAHDLFTVPAKAVAFPTV